jgi:aldehyde dehydrogenase (NAD+)
VNSSTAIPLRTKFAFAEARRAQSRWARTPLRQRLKCIRRARHVIAERCISIATTAGEEFGEAITAQVLPLADACRFIERRAAKLLAPRALGRQHRPIWLRGVESEVVREPIGVVLIIAPANYPLLLPGVQLLQALTAGNAVLLKPGRGGDAAARALLEICRAAGMDQRLVAVLPSTEAAAREALALPIDKVFFTGSSEAGQEVLARLAPRVVPAVVELSGCDAAIVRADADLSLAASALAFGLALNNGATCVAPRRVLVARPLLERLG